MAITPANYAAFITTVDTTVGQIYSQMDPAMTIGEWTTTYPMKGSILNLGWTGRLPKWRPWFDVRTVYEPAAQSFQIEPVPYESTIGIDRFILEDSDVNTMSVFWRMLPDMATQMRRQPEYEMRDLLEGTGLWGLSKYQNGFDGLSFFNTSHPIDYYNPGFVPKNALFASGTYCNDFTGGGQTINGTLIGGPFGIVSFSTVRQYMKLIPDESGETLGIMPNALMVPETLEIEAMFVLKATTLAPPTWGAFQPLTGQVGAADNQMTKLGCKIIVNPWLSNTKKWYLFDTTHSMKPFLWIVREAPRIVPRINENDPIVFDSHRFLWGGWDRVAAAPNYSWLFARGGP
jgi:phage major head subunit gpT-like protein